MARTRQELLDYIRSIQDPGAATDEELQQLLGAYEELSAQPEKRQVLNESAINELKSTIRKKFGGFVSEDLAKQAAQFVISRIGSGNTANLDLNFAEFINDRVGSGVGPNYFRDLRQFGIELSQDYGHRPDINVMQDVPQDFSGEIGSLKGIQSARAFEAERSGAIDELLTGFPDELAASREDFLTGEYGYAGEAFKEYIPRALSKLNKRGLLFSGDVEDELVSTALELQGGLEALEAQMIADDNQFYFDAAYQNQLRKTISSTEDYRAAIEGERNRVFTERENRFKSYQSELDRNLDETLKRSDLDRQEMLTRAKLKAQRDARDADSRGDLFADILRTGTTIAVTRGVSGAPKSTPKTVG